MAVEIVDVIKLAHKNLINHIGTAWDSIILTYHYRKKWDPIEESEFWFTCKNVIVHDIAALRTYMSDNLTSQT